jgi:hypothetical protein
MSESRPGFFEKIIQMLSAEAKKKLLTDLDKRVRMYLTDIMRRVAKKLIVMIAGVTIALIGSLFIFVAFAKYLNEILHSTWMGWGIGGLVMLVIGLVVYTLGRR